LAGIGVAGERHPWERRPLTLGPHDLTGGAHPLQPAAQRGDAIAGQAAVGLDLRLARAPGADAAAQPLQVRPQAAHARQVVLELGQLHLQLPVGGVGVVGEDVEDHRGAIDHGDAQRLLQGALLAGGELVVAGHEVRVRVGDRRPQLAHLARAHVAVGMGVDEPKQAGGLAYREAGPPAGEAAAGTALFVHGWPESSWMWRGVMGPLADAGWRAIAPDLAGFGDSPAYPPGTWERQIRALDNLYGALDPGSVALVVHDWGGLIGLRWACDRPEAVRALCISDTGFFPDGRWH